ncbi:hypothetical protein [Dokdonella ginsengisoli]|uniref:Uncharacterized protein n=1 Tax=Dokdonella ginsengisoli TaxID=363846 RepID=A0ABV9QS45_9GAMM
MNRRVLATIAGLTLAGACVDATAVALNPKGLGQVLLFPYYTVNKGQDTLISLVNVGDVGKYLRVDFYEGYNGRPVLGELHLFLSPHDVWTAGISADGDGAKLTTSDRSCVYPASLPGGEDIRTTGLRFRTAGFDGDYAIFQLDGGPTDMSRVREGTIHVLTIGDIVPGSETDERIRHVQNGTPGEGTPADCEQVHSAGIAELTAPTDTLAGSAAIVDVTQGTFYPYNADALSDFSDMVIFTSSAIHPSLLGAANSDESTVFGAVAHVFADRGTPLQLDYHEGIDAVSAVLMADHLYNEYLVSDNLGSNTDWVVTFPTKRFYVDTYYTGGAGAMPPFVEEFDGESNILFRGIIYDREEGETTWPPENNGPPPLSGLKGTLPFEVNVISWLNDTAPDDPSGVFGSKLRPNIAPYADAGWAAFDLDPEVQPHALPPDASGKILRGLPVSGFMAYNIVNRQAQPGRLANYSGVFAHRTSVSCTTADPQATCQ